jgi:hypothetical protein
MNNYTDSQEKNLASSQFASSYFTADELRALKEKWKAEENRLNNSNICGFDENIGAKEVFTKLPNIDLLQEQLDTLQESAKKYRFNQKMAIEREAEKRSANKATVEVYADMIKVRVPTKNPVQGGGERKEIKGFSVNSRRRLIQKMAQWNLNGLWTSFLTLTYPRLYATNWKIWKRDIEVFFKRLARKYPDIVGLCWRLEEQKRGAPHFHLIVASDGSICTCGTQEMRDYKGQKRLVHKHDCIIHQFRKDIALMWADVVASGYKIAGGDMAVYAPEYEKHLSAGTNAESVNSRKQLMAYVSKYLAKVEVCESCKGKNVVDSICRDCGCIKEKDNSIQGWGRIWGFRDLNGELDFAPIETVELDYEEAVNLKRIVRKWMKARGNVKYAQRINGMVSYSVLGLGYQSENNGLVSRMVSGVRAGLFAAHISPRDKLELGCTLGVPFQERLQMGLYEVRKGFVENDRVITPLGRARVSQIKYCEILGRQRVAVYLDTPQEKGVRLAAFDVWQVKRLGNAVQVSLC